jgi:Nucleotidyltransferase domain
MGVNGEMQKNPQAGEYQVSPAAFRLPITIPGQYLREFCERNHIRKLSLFGSVLTERFRPESDVDMLVEFDPDHTTGPNPDCGTAGSRGLTRGGI